MRKCCTLTAQYLYAICVLLCLTASFNSFAQSNTFQGAQKAGGVYGTGTELDPYLIRTNLHLLQLADSVNNKGYTYQGKFFKIDTTASITATNVIGDATHPFEGTFDGDTIEVILNISPTLIVTHYGLFGHIKNATIKNLEVKSTTTVTPHTAATYVGGICAFVDSNSKIIRCNSSINFSASQVFLR
ncbi:hypothetical protein FACS1894121_0490 [Bacteroidia bacterium]|nr:hypothetical protein FACS1894121_0490 [Bacteroidia bacterium]